MTDHPSLGGPFTFPGTSLTVNRIGYGAMKLYGTLQLMGEGVWGPPHAVDAAISLLREAIALGINHIDTSDFYGPHITNQLIQQALHPYPEDLVIVTKVGYRRGEGRSLHPATSAREITEDIHDNLRNLGLEAIPIVNLRLGNQLERTEDSLEEPLAALIDLKRQGLIRHIGLSNITPRQFRSAQSMTEIVCVQNLYNLTQRDDDLFLDELARQGIAYVPYFPLGGFTPLQSSILEEAATSLGASPMQVALAWLLQRSPNILLIPGTSSAEHLRENLKAGTLQLPPHVIADLNLIVAGAHNQDSRPEL